MKYLMAAAAVLCLTGGAAMAQNNQPYDGSYAPNAGDRSYGNEGPSDRGSPSYDQDGGPAYGDGNSYGDDGRSYRNVGPSNGADQGYGGDPRYSGNYQGYNGYQPYATAPSYYGGAGAYRPYRPFIGGYYAPGRSRAGFFHPRRPARHIARFATGRGRSFIHRGRHNDRR